MTGVPRSGYSDLMVMSPNGATTIIELVATETWHRVKEHYERTLIYSKSQKKHFALDHPFHLRR